MAITLFPPEKPERFRITRSVKGRNYQFYVPFGKNIEKARKKAEEIDQSLAQRQRAHKIRCDLDGLSVVHEETGKIWGVHFNYRLRSGRTPKALFQCRYHDAALGRAVYKTFEENRSRTFDEAFLMAVNWAAEKRGISKDSLNYQRMLATKPVYEKEYRECREGKAPPPKVATDADALALALQQEVAQFQEKRSGRVIRG